MSTPRIYVIHRAEDEERAYFVERRYAEIGVDFEFFYATDGHNIEALAPFRNMVPKHFWGQDEIKPGAFACFLSHQRVWAAIADGKQDYAIIAEDDSAPSADFVKLWKKYKPLTNKFDLVFLNNRIASWIKKSNENMLDAVESFRQAEMRHELNFRAPGADGYLITKKGAEKLLRLSVKMQAICGVDWFLIGAYWNSRRSKVPETDEFQFLAKEFADMKPIGKAKVVRDPMFTINKDLESSIQHSKKINILELRQKLTSNW